jgi:predicted enzyme related to lactoylglutathione lyase
VTVTGRGGSSPLQRIATPQSAAHFAANLSQCPADAWQTRAKPASATGRYDRGGVLTAVHLLIYSDEPAATRAFLRDVLEWSCVEDEDSAPGWLIFKAGPSELGVHPTHETHEGVTYDSPRHHSISLMCDDIQETKARLESNGAEFTGPVEDKGFGFTVMMKLPGADDVMLYEPRHPLAYSL